jgi:hypothetical protein
VFETIYSHQHLAVLVNPFRAVQNRSGHRQK